MARADGTTTGHEDDRVIPVRSTWNTGDCLKLCRFALRAEVEGQGGSFDAAGPEPARTADPKSRQSADSANAASISSRIARAASARRGAFRMGRPTTRWSAPQRIACVGVVERL